jgi:PPP family 3-phenylpropionic acid transporter
MPARASLGLFYLAYFATLGVYLPYFTLYLEHLGLDPFRIAAVAAILPLLKATAPIAWGLTADRSGRRWALTVVSCALSLVCLLLLQGVESFGAVCAVMALYGLFSSGMLPLVEATALETVTGEPGGYGATRVWGSFGFILIASAWGWVLDSAGIRWVIHGLAALTALNLLSTLALPRPSPRSPAADAPAAPPLPGLVAALFFASTFLQQASHGPYYAYFSLHLQEQGWSRIAIGSAWVVGVLSEVLMMIGSERLIARVGLPALLGVAHAAAVVRWLLLSWLESPALVLGSQVLHALTFGAFHVGSVRRTAELFPPQRRGFGQALYSALTYGAGSAAGMLGGGALYGRLGVRGLFVAGAAAALLSLAAQLCSDVVARRGSGAERLDRLPAVR